MNVYIRPFFDSFTAGSPGGVGKRILLSFLGVLLLAVGGESASVSDILSNQTPHLIVICTDKRCIFLRVGLTLKYDDGDTLVIGTINS